LGDMQLGGGAREAAGPDDGDEVAELAQLHRFIVQCDEFERNCVLDLSLIARSDWWHGSAVAAASRRCGRCRQPHLAHNRRASETSRPCA
jgi:hypothetical protein